MKRQIKREKVEGPQGRWNVSTIRTDVGGADEYRPSAMGVSGMVTSPLSSRDYIDDTPWPFETMVFKGGAFGHYHRAYKSLRDAIAGHNEIVAAIEQGTLEVGAGIRGPFGAPSLTPEDWRNGITQGPNMQGCDLFDTPANQ